MFITISIAPLIFIFYFQNTQLIFKRAYHHSTFYSTLGAMQSYLDFNTHRPRHSPCRRFQLFSENMSLYEEDQVEQHIERETETQLCHKPSFIKCAKICILSATLVN